MEMAPYSFYGGDGDWYRALDSFPPLCSSSALAMGASSEEGRLQIAAAPPNPPRRFQINNYIEGSESDHCPLLAADSSSPAMILSGDEDSYQLPVDPFYFDRLPPVPPPADGGATAGLDDALLQASFRFSDIDLDAFGDAIEHKVPVAADDNSMVIAPPDGFAAGQGAGGGVGDQKPAMAVDADSYRPAGNAFDLAAVVAHGDGAQHRHAISPVPAAMPPPPPSMPVVALPHGRRRSGVRSVAAAGKTRLDHIGFEEIRKYFYMPITKAAREMNVGLTVLKKRCRELGVARWPHRKMKSLRSLILNVQEMGKGMSPEAVQRELAALETYCALMEEDPSIELTDRTKKLRQACFKESYKRRRAATVGGVMDHIYDFAHGHHELTLHGTSSGGAEHGLMQNSNLFGY